MIFPCDLALTLVCLCPSWDYFPHDMATYRAYQWGEDGLFGMCDEGVNVCLSLALWNGNDTMLKERLFGLTAYQVSTGSTKVKPRSNQGQTKVKHRRDTIFFFTFFLINNFTQIYTIDFFQLCCMLEFMLVVCCMLVVCADLYVLCLFKA